MVSHAACSSKRVYTCCLGLIWPLWPRRAWLYNIPILGRRRVYCRCLRLCNITYYLVISSSQNSMLILRGPNNGTIMAPYRPKWVLLETVIDPKGTSMTVYSHSYVHKRIHTIHNRYISMHSLVH